MDKKIDVKVLEHDGFRSSDWARKGSREWARRKVFAEFSRWVAELRDSRLAEKAGKLWQTLLDGGLGRADVAAVIGALLYCITPIDLSPDVIPVIGYLDDLLTVMAVLSYLETKNRR
jgi:uncharacterized membrane protein YkvA (DUF1232 family)